MQILQERLSCPSSTVANSNLPKEAFRLYPVTPRTNAKSSLGKVTCSYLHTIQFTARVMETGLFLLQHPRRRVLTWCSLLVRQSYGTRVPVQPFGLFLCSIPAMILRGVTRDRVVFAGRNWFYPNRWLSSGALLSQIRRSASGRTMLTRASMWFKNRVNIGRVRFQAHRLGGRSP